MRDVQDKLTNIAKDLLASKKVELVLGFEPASLPMRTRACFARNADAAGRLVWNEFCSHNLAAYLLSL